MTPGTYLAKRREAFGLTVSDVASAASYSMEDARRWIQRVHAIERCDRPATADDIDVFHGLFNFDPAILGLLTAGRTDIRICRECACTWDDPCFDEETGPCAWSASDPDLCTTCEAKAPARVPELNGAHQGESR